MLLHALHHLETWLSHQAEVGHPSPRSGTTSPSDCLFTPAGCAAHRRLPSKVTQFQQLQQAGFGLQHISAQLGTAWLSLAAGPTVLLLPGPFSSAFLHTVRCCVCSMGCLPTVTSAFPVAIPGTITHSQPRVRPTLPLETHSKSSASAGWGHTGTGWPSQITPHPGTGTTFS